MANAKIATWATDAWNHAKQAGLFDGTRPGAPLTRQEAAVTYQRLNLIGGAHNNAVAMKNSVLTGAAIVGTMLANALGGWDAALALLIGMMAADYITGLLVAALWQNSNKSETGALDSKAGFKGLCKKGVILLVVFAGTLVDNAIGANYVRTDVVFFFIGNEGISLLENVGLMGVPYPPALKKALEALMDKGRPHKTLCKSE